MTDHLYIKTPLIEKTEHLLPGKTVYFKMETSQPCGSFKLRGMECACRDAAESGRKRLLSSSGGNAGLAVAWCGRALKMPTTVVLPVTTPEAVASKLRSLGAEVIIHGDAWDNAHAYCLELCREDASVAYIPPFDHPKLWEGHASMIDELKEQCPVQPDLIICSVGGGGLMNGIVEGLRRNHWEDTHIAAVETIGTDSLYQAWKAGHLVTLDGITSIAKSLGAKCVAEKTLENVLTRPILPVLVEDLRAAKACVSFADEFRVLVEPACGASLALIYDNMEILEPFKNIVVIVCGGSSVNTDMIAGYKAM